MDNVTIEFSTLLMRPINSNGDEMLIGADITLKITSGVPKFSAICYNTGDKLELSPEEIDELKTEAIIQSEKQGQEKIDKAYQKVVCFMQKIDDAIKEIIECK